MNQGKWWLVVDPGKGLPLFVSSVAMVAIIVHLVLAAHSVMGYSAAKGDYTGRTWIGAHTGKAPAPAPDAK